MMSNSTKEILALDWYKFTTNPNVEGDGDSAGETDSSTGQVLPDGTGSEGTGTNEGEPSGTGASETVDGGEPKPD
ncbi:hypothetical protein DIRTYBETTY_111 [Bacillus phage DirtyBetty]|nr:hypothetical protein BIZ88_gp111 [Bacillus phage DirtyBetty]ANT41420.1 hypothetical protein DIRTYBETTY_111 [Bacillus phage DirtyBetty]